MTYSPCITADLFRTTKAKVRRGDLCLDTVSKDCLFTQYLYLDTTVVNLTPQESHFFNTTIFIGVALFERLEKSIFLRVFVTTLDTS